MENGFNEIGPAQYRYISRVLNRYRAIGEPVLLSEAYFNKQLGLGPSGGHACSEAPEVSSSVPDFLQYLSWQEADLILLHKEGARDRSRNPSYRKAGQEIQLLMMETDKSTGCASSNQLRYPQ